MTRVLSLAALLFMLALSNACNNYGTLEVRVTNGSPIVAKIPGHTIDTAVVTISDISVHTSASANASDAGWSSILLTNNVELDLMSIEGGLTKLLGMIGLPAGTYQQIRVTVASASITIDSLPEVIAVTIPSGVVKMNLGITVVDGQQYGVRLDFNLSESLSLNGNTWRMAPPVINVLEIYQIRADGCLMPIVDGLAQKSVC